MRIAILLAVYEPNPAWLQEQLLSLNRQTHVPLELYVRDDASPTFPYAELERMLSQTVTRFPWHCERNAKNTGSNQVFSDLTLKTEADAFAYCDQDDVWEPEKLAVLAKAMERERATLAYGDVRIIDASGVPTAQTIRTVKPHIVYQTGAGLAPFFLTGNCVTGCAALVRADVAKNAVPFLQETVYDQWLALCAAQGGTLSFVREPVANHRIHSGNQTATLGGIRTKADYIQRYIKRDERRAAEFSLRVNLGAQQRRFEAWTRARSTLARGEPGAWRKLLRLANVRPNVSFFELALPLMPETAFRAACRLIRRGVL